jgi:hypothetical protein
MDSVSQEGSSQPAKILFVCMSIGAIASILVYVGDALQWPHFNRRAGYIGTEFIGTLLYAINDPYAIHIVACLWFLYGCIVTGAILVLCRHLFHKRDSNTA